MKIPSGEAPVRSTLLLGHGVRTECGSIHKSDLDEVQPATV